MRTLTLVLILAVAFLAAGCSDESIATGGAQPVPPVGTIVINNVLARAIPATVTGLRFRGVDSGGRVVYSPDPFPVAPQIVLDNVPTTVVLLQIEYLQGNVVVGTYSQNVSIAAGQTVTIDDPAWVDSTAVPTSLAITPADPSLAAGVTQQLAAVGTFTDQSTRDFSPVAIWTSSNPAAATVSNTGLLTAVAPGSTTVQAVVGGLTASTTVTVSSASLTSLQLTPANPSLALGATQQMTLTGSFSDGSTQDLTTTGTWTSADPTVATVSDTAPGKGLVTANMVAAGSTTLSVQAFGQTLTTPVTVTGPSLIGLQVFPVSRTFPAGFSLQLTAQGLYSDNTVRNVTGLVAWTSSNEAAVTVSAAGQATAVAVGTARATATFAGFSDGSDLTVSGATLVSLLVTPGNLPQAGVGRTEDFSAFGTFSDASVLDLTNQVTWASDMPAFASIDVSGRATAVAVGTAGITATLGAVVSPNQPFTVTAVSTDYTVTRVPFQYDPVDDGVLVVSGDDKVASVPAGQGFDFSFFGTPFIPAQIFPNTNGLITFGTSSASLGPAPALPNAANANSIQGFFSDLTGLVRAKTLGSAPNRRLILDWDGGSFSAPFFAAIFQVVLFEGTNEIEFRYQDTAPDLGTQASAGVNNATGTVGTQLGRGQQVLLPGTAFRLSPP